MAEGRLINVYDLPTVYNVCNQILREIISLPKVSMAHVIMEEGNVSLWHKHSNMGEIYFILEGEGILYQGNRSLKVKEDSYQIISKNTPHALENTGKSNLEHLVFAIPPFNLEDVEILNDSSSKDFISEEFKYDKSPITALDGALIYELMNEKERKDLDVALAVGFLPQRKKAIPHHHLISEELYYVTKGEGKVKVGKQIFGVKKGSVICVPVNQTHALENESDSEELKILCVSSPSYTEGDFILEK